MGAVFALYSAWYFWIPKILGVDYNRSMGKVHFWILFIGVNVTFFPQHFLGLQGMPRRISDYADAFAGWNMISSFGSIISVIATLLFLQVLYTQLTIGKSVLGYIWSMPSYFSDALQALIIRSYDSLEWALSSPPKPHAFVSLPVQSSMNFRLINKISLLLLTAFFIFALRLPFKAIFDDLDMLAYYPIINTGISLLLAYCVTTASLKKLSRYRIGFIIAMGAVLPLLVFFVTNNLDSVWLSIEALVNLYTLYTVVSCPIEPGNFLFSTSSGGNTGSSGGAGIGSSSGAGIGSSSGAGVGNSSGAGVGSSSDSTSLREELDEATRVKQEELDRATTNLANLKLQENLMIKTATYMEIEKKRIEELCRIHSKSADYMAEQISDMEDYYQQQLELEIEAEKLRQAAGNAPYANTWRDELDAPGTLLKRIQEAGVHDCDGLNKAQRKAIFRETRDAIKYETPPKDMLENPTLKKHMGYVNSLARVELEVAGLDAAKRHHPETVSEKKINENKAGLSLAKLLITNRLNYRTMKYNTKDRETCENNVSYSGDTYYRSQDESKNNVRWPVNHDHDNNDDVD